MSAPPTSPSASARRRPPRATCGSTRSWPRRVTTGADAIHPGYGFLAERAEFARAVEAAGLTFVGPGWQAIAALGDKLAARRTAVAADVAGCPGTFEPAPVDRPGPGRRDCSRRPATIGFPLMVKAAAGGGGRGMRRVARAEDLPAALVAGSREAAAAFGDGSVYLEREIRPARHVEVQLLGDRHGQRRRARRAGLLDPAAPPEARRGVAGARPDAATSAGACTRWRSGRRRRPASTNAATAEFLLDADGRFWFLEVNARLQVEHGVTELVTGLDLVVEQFWIAAGRPLSPDVLAAAERPPIPAATRSRSGSRRRIRPMASRRRPGRVGRWRMPAGPGVRVDTAIEAGERIPPDYDPLIAKIMVDAADRHGARSRACARALDEVEVTGIQTTLPFHRALCAQPALRRAATSRRTGSPRSGTARLRRAAAASSCGRRRSVGRRAIGSDGIGPVRTDGDPRWRATVSPSDDLAQTATLGRDDRATRGRAAVGRHGGRATGGPGRRRRRRIDPRARFGVDVAPVRSRSPTPARWLEPVAAGHGAPPTGGARGRRARSDRASPRPARAATRSSSTAGASCSTSAPNVPPGSAPEARRGRRTPRTAVRSRSVPSSRDGSWPCPWPRATQSRSGSSCS